MVRPAENLVGVDLPGGWHVDEKIQPHPAGTGGHFSTGYLVTRSDGTQGFLKAMDYTAAQHSADFVDHMKVLSSAYVFERDICIRCRDRRVTRVVHAIDYGNYEPPFAASLPLPQMMRVEYLIFERADGDIRRFIATMGELDVVVVLRALHNAAAALQQLHGTGIAHQDLKPSNVLVFKEAGLSKLGDLGRSWSRDIPAPHDTIPFAGDLQYAPIERLYGQVQITPEHRYCYDLYLLGSLVVFMFTGVNVNALVINHLDVAFAPSNTQVFADALPYLQAAFADVIEDFASHVPRNGRERLKTIVAELCDPDPSRRGNPPLTGLPRFSLQRYISTFDLLATMAEVRLFGE